MNLSIVQEPPTNLAKYQKVPGTECREEFIKFLRALLNKKTERIYTDDVALEWIDMVHKLGDLAGYSISMQQIPVNFGEPSTASGIFYFKRNP